MEFCDKVGFTVTVLCFVDIRSDGSAAAKDLFGQYCFMLCFDQVGMQLYDPGAEVYGFIDQDVGFHNITHGYYIGKGKDLKP